MPHLRLPHSPKEYVDYTLTLPPGGATDTVVVYLHGFASHQKGEKVLYFRDRFTEAGWAFVAFDHRGHGGSSGTMAEMTVTHNLEDLEAILTSPAAGFTRRVLLGSSMGGQTAAWYAARHPNQVAANLLIAPGFRFLQNRMRDLGSQGLKQLEREGTLAVRNEWVEVIIGKGLIEDAAKYPVDRLIPDYATPTLIMHGTQDTSVPFEDSVAFVETSKARPLELFLIAGGDHRLTEYKATLFSAMEAFLKRTGLLQASFKK